MVGRNDFSINETLMKIATKHGKSVAQGANQSKKSQTLIILSVATQRVVRHSRSKKIQRNLRHALNLR